MRRTAKKLDELSLEEQERSKARFREKADEQECSDPQVFARNLNHLVQMKGLTLKEVAERTGAKYQWIRRIASRGMVRIADDNRPFLKKLARLFEINRIEDLWMPDLIVFKVNKEEPALTKEWLQEELVPYAKKVVVLLASGEHEYLKDLIDTLMKDMPSEPDGRDTDEDEFDE